MPKAHSQRTEKDAMADRDGRHKYREVIASELGNGLKRFGSACNLFVRLLVSFRIALSLRSDNSHLISMHTVQCFMSLQSIPAKQNSKNTCSAIVRSRVGVRMGVLKSKGKPMRWTEGQWRSIWLMMPGTRNMNAY